MGNTSTARKRNVGNTSTARKRNVDEPVYQNLDEPVYEILDEPVYQKLSYFPRQRRNAVDMSHDWSITSLDNGENFDFLGEEDTSWKETYVPGAFVNNPLHFDLYMKALSQGFEHDKNIRVNVVGNYAQGKTSLTKILVGKTRQTVQSTNGVEINKCKYFEAHGDVTFYETTFSDDNEIIDRIAEVAKNVEENFTNDTSDSEPLNCESLLNTLPQLPERHETILQNDTKAVEEKNQHFSNEHDQPYENFSEINDSASPSISEAEEMSRWNPKPGPKTYFNLSLTAEEQHKFSSLLSSEQSMSTVNGNLEIWDFAGQFVFYATHTLFHSRRAVYLLVFDLSKPLSEVVKDSEYPLEAGDKTMEQFIKFWVNSIHSYVGSNDGSEPPIILVGTHKDKLKGNEQEKSEHAENYFERIRSLFEDTPILNHIHAKDFVVNSTDPNDKEIIKLRQEIIQISMKQSTVKIPARWLALEKELIRLRHMKIIPFTKVLEIDSQNVLPIEDEEQIKLFLLYHHKKGTLFFFDEDPISAYVVLDTQYLIDAFRCIVTSERFCRKEPQYRCLWNVLRQEGKLSMELIEKVWDSNSVFFEHKKKILMFMQRHYIISEVSSFDEITETPNYLGWYIVPIFLRDHSDNLTIKKFLTGKKQTSLRFVMSFQYTPVIQIIYCRLIAAMVAKWPVVSIGISKQDREYFLYENLGVFRLDHLNAGIVELQQSIIDLRVISLCKSQNVNSVIVDRFRRFAESVVINEFNKLRYSSEAHCEPYKICFRCNNESHGLNGSQDILPFETLADKTIEPCLDITGDHEINPEPALSEWFVKSDKIQLLKDSPLDDKQLSKIAQSLGSNWQLLGIELGLSNAEIDQISMDYQPSSMRIFKMLLRWVAIQHENATFNNLIQAIKSTKTLTVDWDIVMNLVDDIASKQETEIERQ